jgi:hypothetical protein
MNTEKMVIVERNGEYINRVLNFKGSLEDAFDFAEKHNFGGGVEILNRGYFQGKNFSIIKRR